MLFESHESWIHLGRSDTVVNPREACSTCRFRASNASSQRSRGILQSAGLQSLQWVLGPAPPSRLSRVPVCMTVARA